LIDCLCRAHPPVLLLLCSRYGRLETYHKAERLGFTTPCLLLCIQRGLPLEGRAFGQKPLRSGPHETRFFEELGFAAGGVGNRCNSAIVALCVYHCRVRGTLRICLQR